MNTSVPAILVIKKTCDFQTISKEGRKFFSKTVLLIKNPNPTDQRRVGYTVSKKVGGAVVRNKAKRRLREAVRALGSNLRLGFDYNLIALREISSANYQQILSDLRFVLNTQPNPSYRTL